MADEDKGKLSPLDNRSVSPLAPGGGSPLGPSGAPDWDGLSPLPRTELPSDALDKLAASAAAGRAAYDAAQAAKPKASRISRAPPPPPSLDPSGGGSRYPASEIRQELERSHEAHEASQRSPPIKELVAEKPATVHGPGTEVHGVFAKPFTWEDLLVGGFATFVAGPICEASWHAIVVEPDAMTRGLIGLAIGLPTGLAGASFHWWKDRTPKFRDWIARQAKWWCPAALFLVFAYVTGPEMYRRATKPIVVTGAIGAMPIGFTQEQVNEKIITAVANLNSQLTEANRQKEIAMRDAGTLRKQIQNTPPPPRPNYDEPRVYTTKTIADLRGFYKDRTALQGAAFMADEIGKWITAEGQIQFIRPDGLVFLSNDGGIISCEFDASWKPKLSAFRPGEIMKVVGKIGDGQIGYTPIYLRPCEIPN